MTGSLQLIKSVSLSLIIYSIQIYDWPIKIIKIIERWFGNFLWSGDIDKQKFMIVSWHKCCKAFKEEGWKSYLLAISTKSLISNCVGIFLENIETGP